jgi:type IV pilus assembly protein PilE
MTGLMQLHSTQERWRTDHDSYATLSELQHKGVSPLGYYQLSVTAVTTHGFEGLATAMGMQAHDTSCQVMKIIVDGGTTTYSAISASNVDSSSANLKRCWFQ